MAPVERALRESGHEQFLVHTGQHFDRNLSEVFFEQLGIPEPNVNLGVGAGSHAVQTAHTMAAIEPVILTENPDLVIVYGDVNSTLAATLVATKLHIPVAHVEAGLRSGDRSMPEEVNRIVVDSISDQLFTTAEEASYNLVREGIEPRKLHFVGNPMIDTLLRHRSEIDQYDPASANGISGDYALVTLHRPGNVDDRKDAMVLERMLAEAAKIMPILFPIHPRAASRLRLSDIPRLVVVEPLGYLEFLAAMARSRITITDSGGVQEETTVLGVPCLTVRESTERPVTITNGTNQLVSRKDVVAKIHDVMSADVMEATVPPLWDGHAGVRIASSIEARFLT
ncbi:MAG: UDP-N-acetylglucosamine 2-epimerase (non-hydrolyzing) [Pseudoxanthomonas suwonensis]|nr:MAG: UDP-N-acetylglucosamine 2-epimerase (non-hydrolyzing) [Pseudoxanthomonas suwonensis]